MPIRLHYILGGSLVESSFDQELTVYALIRGISAVEELDAVNSFLCYFST
jgi:hypothetical protein